MKENAYQPRTYRCWVEGKDLVPFTVTEKETDLYIRAATDLERKARRLVRKYREQLESYITRDPAFQSALEPVPVPAGAPAIVRRMAEAARLTGVGPMAAVAGAIAECVGTELLEFSPEVIVENGGDIFLKIKHGRTVGIFAGDSPLTGKIGIRIEARDTPEGVCTSSGTVGHSLSYGRADAVVVMAPSAALADAAATAVGNRVSRPEDIDGAIEFARGVPGLRSVVIIVGESIGVQGDIRLCETG
jgi:ApbE superfamily uncharacterized protein (UPF0280 family)